MLTEHEMVESSAGIGGHGGHIQGSFAQNTLRVIKMATIGVQNEDLLLQRFGEPQWLHKPEGFTRTANKYVARYGVYVGVVQVVNYRGARGTFGGPWEGIPIYVVSAIRFRT